MKNVELQQNLNSRKTECRLQRAEVVSTAEPVVRKVSECEFDTMIVKLRMYK
jgi:hypothetical protein